MQKNVLIVLTSNDQLGDTGKKTDFWLEELASPYYILKDAGVTLTLASPKGGPSPIDPVSQQKDFQTDATRRIENDPEAMAQLATTRKLSDLDAADFDAILYPGGQAPLWDLVSDADSIQMIEAMWAADKPVATVCHAGAVLANVRDADGDFIVQGREVTGFSNSEEAEYGTTDVVPLLVEDTLKERGGKYVHGENWVPSTRQDGRLITGQNPASSGQVADLLLSTLDV